MKHQTIPSLVRQAEPIARRFLDECFTNRNDGSTSDLVAKLLGHDPGRDFHEDQITAFSEAVDAAYAVGIAVGLLLRPDVFAQEPRRRSRVRRPRLIATIGPAEPAEGGAR
jgi:hypothetical protein